MEIHLLLIDISRLVFMKGKPNGMVADYLQQNCLFIFHITQV